MGLLSWIFGKSKRTKENLLEVLQIHENQLIDLELSYKEFQIRKRDGSNRTLFAPNEKLKAIQKLINRNILSNLKAHDCVKGFEKSESIVTNASEHVKKAIIVKLDIKDFFSSSTSDRVSNYFKTIGWNNECAGLLTEICTLNGFLPQGAPTSPRLSNLINFRMDARLSGLGKQHGFSYTRYADDLSFSSEIDSPKKARFILSQVGKILKNFDYQLNPKKAKIVRQNVRMLITGLIVNEKVQLPRETRKWLRAVEHRKSLGKTISISEEQLNGWRNLLKMIEKQRFS